MWTHSSKIHLHINEFDFYAGSFKMYFGCGLTQEIFWMRTHSRYIFDADPFKMYFYADSRNIGCGLIQNIFL